MLKIHGKNENAADVLKVVSQRMELTSWGTAEIMIYPEGGIQCRTLRAQLIRGVIPLLALQMLHQSTPCF